MTTYIVTKYRAAKMTVRNGECTGYELSREVPEVAGSFPSWQQAVDLVRGAGGRHSVNFNSTAIFDAPGGWHYDITVVT